MLGVRFEYKRYATLDLQGVAECWFGIVKSVAVDKFGFEIVEAIREDTGGIEEFVNSS